MCARPVLTRFDRLILKRKSAQDPTQVPADGALVDFYRQGATASEPSTIAPLQEDVPVAVYDVGQLVDGDPIEVGVGGPALVVSRVIAETQLLVTNNTANPVSIAAGDRLIPTTARPRVHGDPLGTDPGTSQLGAPAGRAGAYVSEPRFDHVISGAGISPARLYRDARGGTAPSPGWLDARDFPSLQAAIDALGPAKGGVITSRPGSTCCPRG